MNRRVPVIVAALAVAVLAAQVLPVPLHAQESDLQGIQTLNECNGVLKALWMDIQIEELEFLSIGKERKSVRLHIQPARWVPFDSRRNDDGNRLTYLVDDQDTSGSGLESGAVKDAIERATQSWSRQWCFRNVGVEKRDSGGADADIFDALFGFGGFGDYRLADIVHAGWMPPAFFDAIGGEGGGETIAAVSVTFIFVDSNGKPTDVNRDGFLDTALNEIYYNSGFPWRVEWWARGLDLETVALHELGHSLGLGHFTQPIRSVMAPVYLGPHRSLEFVDKALLCSVWGTWSGK